MYPGYLTLGTEDPFLPGVDVMEIVNNQRAYAYARNAGICWLYECDACPEAEIVVPGGPNFISPIIDPAPWFVDDDPDSWGFLGVVGLEVSGAYDSTRQSEVKMAVSGIGVFGPSYMAPRTMVLRGLAVAEDECSLSWGLAWLRKQYATQQDPCLGDPLTFFDCCPCVCDDPGVGGPCWPVDYDELSEEPPCVAADPSIWWPDTYDELIAGPPTEDENWCAWPEFYIRLILGPPAWSCCIDACVIPYMRQFHNTRVTEGPIVLRHPVLSSHGAVAEIEFTIVAADPLQHSMPVATMGARWLSAAETVVDPEPEEPAVDPWAEPVLVGAS